MRVQKLIQLTLLGALVLPGAASLTACGNGGEVKHAQVKVGEMPANEEWPGVYFSPVFGYLHLLTDGKTAQGAWRTAGGDAWGELQGEVDGDLLRYSWTQHKIGMIGREAESNGKGYFKFTKPKEGEAAHIVGEWGLGESDAGNTWEAVKQKNMAANPDSVKPDEIEGKVNAGGWDEDDKGSEKKKPDGDAPEAP